MNRDSAIFVYKYLLDIATKDGRNVQFSFANISENNLNKFVSELKRSAFANGDITHSFAVHSRINNAWKKEYKAWNVYDIFAEFSRQKVPFSNKEWRVSLINKEYKYCETYPSHFDPCPGGVMGPDETFEENAARELAEEMGIVTGSALAPQPPEPLFDFWFEDATIRNWGRLFKVTFEGDLADLSLQDEEVDSVSWMDRAELARLLDTGPVCPDAALACRRWLASGEAGSP